MATPLLCGMASCGVPGELDDEIRGRGERGSRRIENETADRKLSIGRLPFTWRVLPGAQLHVALTIFMAVAFKVPLDDPIPDMLESPIFMFDMLVSFICDIWPFVVSPVSVTVCPT